MLRKRTDRASSTPRPVLNLFLLIRPWPSRLAGFSPWAGEVRPPPWAAPVFVPPPACAAERDPLRRAGSGGRRPAARDPGLERALPVDGRERLHNLVGPLGRSDDPLPDLRGGLGG